MDDYKNKLVLDALKAVSSLRDYVIAFVDDWDMDWQNEQLLHAIDLIESIRGGDDAGKKD